MSRFSCSCRSASSSNVWKALTNSNSEIGGSSSLASSDCIDRSGFAIIYACARVFDVEQNGNKRYITIAIVRTCCSSGLWIVVAFDRVVTDVLSSTSASSSSSINNDCSTNMKVQNTIRFGTIIVVVVIVIVIVLFRCAAWQCVCWWCCLCCELI